MRYGNNVYAPPAYNGIGQADVPANYRDVSFDYVYDITLTASQLLTDQQAIEQDADFVWRATVINNATSLLAAVRFSDSDDYFLSNSRVAFQNIQGDPSSPSPRFPEIVLPSGGKIGIEIEDLSGAQNTIQILFRGVKRYYEG